MDERGFHNITAPYNTIYTTQIARSSLPCNILKAIRKGEDIEYKLLLISWDLKAILAGYLVYDERGVLRISSNDNRLVNSNDG